MKGRINNMKVNHCYGIESVLVDYKKQTFKYYDGDSDEVIDADIEVWLKNSLGLKLLIEDLRALRFKEL
jgi:hypothetical protein